MNQSGERDVDLSVQVFDVQVQLREVREQTKYAQGDPAGVTLVKENDLRVVLLALRRGGKVHWHDVSGPITLTPMEGQFRLHLDSGAQDIAPGSLAALKPGIRHEVEALEDCAFLVTIGRTRYAEVSEHHQPD